MALRDTVKLIPRNNWDYGVGAVATATSGIYHHVSTAPNATSLFRQEPIWTNAGRTSLFAILRGLGLPAGARVSVPLFCCSVVFDAIRQAGLKPCFIDSDAADYNLSTEDLRRKRDGLAAVVATASLDGEALAAAICLVHGGTIVAKYQASDPNRRDIGASHLMHWEVMSDACREGYHSYDLGWTDLGADGLRVFKTRMGAVERTLFYTHIGDRPPREGRPGAVPADHPQLAHVGLSCGR